DGPVLIRPRGPRHRASSPSSSEPNGCAQLGVPSWMRPLGSTQLIHHLITGYENRGGCPRFYGAIFAWPFRAISTFLVPNRAGGTIFFTNFAAQGGPNEHLPAASRNLETYGMGRFSRRAAGTRARRARRTLESVGDRRDGPLEYPCRDPGGRASHSSDDVRGGNLE